MAPRTGHIPNPPYAPHEGPSGQDSGTWETAGLTSFCERNYHEAILRGFTSSIRIASEDELDHRLHAVGVTVRPVVVATKAIDVLQTGIH